MVNDTVFLGGMRVIWKINIRLLPSMVEETRGFFSAEARQGICLDCANTSEGSIIIMGDVFYSNFKLICIKNW